MSEDTNRTADTVTPEDADTTNPELSPGIEESIALEGAERLLAQRQKYIADRVPEKETSRYNYRRSKKIQNAEAYFVGKAFDKIKNAIAASNLNDDQIVHLMDEIVLGESPLYTIKKKEGKLLVRIEIPRELQNAAENNNDLIRAILEADSYGRAMSPGLVGSNEIFTSEESKHALVINALIAGGKNQEGADIDFTSNPIDIDMSVDVTDFAQEEKTKVSEAEAEKKEAEAALKELREAEKPSLKIFEEKMKALVTEAEKEIGVRKQAVDEEVATTRGIIEAREEKLPGLVKEKHRAALASIEAYIAAAADEENTLKREELVKDLKDLIIGDQYTVKQIEEKIGESDSSHDITNLARDLNEDEKGTEIVAALRVLAQQQQSNSRSKLNLKEASRNLTRIEAIVEKGEDLDASDGYNNNSSLKQKLYYLEEEVGEEGLRETIKQLKLIIETKDRNERQLQNAKSYLSNISAALRGDEEGLRGYGRQTQIDLNSAGGLEEAVKEARENLREIDDGEEYAKIAAAIDQVKASMGNAYVKKSGLGIAKDEQEEAVLEEIRQAHIALLSPAWKEDPEIIMGLHYLLKLGTAERNVREESSSSPRTYDNETIVSLPLGNGRYEDIRYEDIGAYRDAYNRPVLQGKSPKLAKELEEAIEEHIGEFDLEAGAGPLTVAAIQRTALDGVNAAKAAIAASEKKAGDWGGSMQVLANQTMDLDDKNLALEGKLKEARSAIGRVTNEMGEVRDDLGKVKSSLGSESKEVTRLATEADEAREATQTARSTGEEETLSLTDKIKAMNAEVVRLNEFETIMDRYRMEMAEAEKQNPMFRNRARREAQKNLNIWIEGLPDKKKVKND